MLAVFNSNTSNAIFIFMYGKLLHMQHKHAILRLTISLLINYDLKMYVMTSNGECCFEQLTELPVTVCLPCCN
jgi:hypothetical protein